MPMHRRIEDEPGLRRITTFDGARASTVPTTRLEDVRRKARIFGEELRAGPKVLFMKTCELVRVPYPTRYAFTGCFVQSFATTPVIHIVNRLVVLQVKTPEGPKIVLFSPSDILANAETRFFKRLGGGKLQGLAGSWKDESGIGRVKAMAQKLVAPITNTVDGWLQELGIAPEDVDYITYDHLHTQDVRNWLGTNDRKALFPNAKLLIMRKEWESAQGLVPPQRDWYCPNGVAGIPDDKVVLLDGSVMVGEGLALVESPGHTMGNHSLVVHTDDGVIVSSENGVAAESYAPHSSRIAAIRKYAKATGAEVILNGNTQESGLEQYISMVMEKEIAGPHHRDGAFTNVLPSSEFAHHWAFPGLRPTFSWEPIEHGALRPRVRAVKIPSAAA
jgi:hypothetical protein